jgi:dimethylhistidine N-methyltransferase
VLDLATDHRWQHDAFLNDVLQGLGQRQKTLPSRWLYDDHGSELFECITQLDEYYPTRTETALLTAHAAQIAAFCSEHAILLEYGAGAGIKTEIVIAALQAPRLYVPIDIAADFLEQTVERFRRRFPWLQTRPIVADFTAAFALPAWVPSGPRVAFFPGSTIGNLNALEVTQFLERMRQHVASDGRAIIGVDLKKSLDILLPAYDDAAGVTAQFNLNLLRRINRELRGSFVLDNFAHSARWNPLESAVEMHLVSRTAQIVTIAEQRFEFVAGETIHTESSRKYDIASFERLARQCGWRISEQWIDAGQLFAVLGLTPVTERRPVT